jgi:pre-mRNA-splicing factor SYF1
MTILPNTWCEWAEKELHHNNFYEANELMKQATPEPSLEVKRRGIIYCVRYMLFF